MIVRAAHLFIAAMAVAGCEFGTVYPAVPRQASEFDPRLLGTWMTADGKETYSISGDSASGYHLLATEANNVNPARYDVRLGSLGTHRVLDITARDDARAAAGVERDLFLPLHFPLFIELLGERVLLRGIESESVTAILEREPKLIEHMEMHGGVALTAPTPELRKFLLKVIRRPGVLSQPESLMRKAP